MTGVLCVYGALHGFDPRQDTGREATMAKARRALARDYSSAEIDHLVEIQGLYDGWSIAVFRDGRVYNRWQSKENCLLPAEGLQRRYEETEKYIQQWFDDEPDEPLELFEDPHWEGRGSE